MWQLVVSSEAELELFEAALRYERAREGLGRRFEARVTAAFGRLVENPLKFPEIAEGARRALVRDFPYGVYFTRDANALTVLAVLHLHRHPDTWRRRDQDTD